MVRSHFFNGRHENIYLTAKHIPELDKLICIIGEHAKDILQRDAFRIGFWFNHMPSGAATTLHRHDDGFELMSAVYYVEAPPDSGDLILHNTEPPTRITPQTGQLIFFSSRPGSRSYVQ